MKTFITNLAVSIMLLTNLSGCMDFDLPDIDISSGFGADYYDYDFNSAYSASFYIDSIVQVSDSKVKIWAQMRYDSVLTIENRNVRYLNERGDEISYAIQSVPDTINFRELPDSTLHWLGRYEWIYQYSVEVDDLKKDFDYSVCISSDYKEKGELRWIEHCIPIRLN